MVGEGSWLLPPHVVATPPCTYIERLVFLYFLCWPALASPRAAATPTPPHREQVLPPRGLQPTPLPLRRPARPTRLLQRVTVPPLRQGVQATRLPPRQRARATQPLFRQRVLVVRAP